jgi:cytochrome c biogenesis factor
MHPALLHTHNALRWIVLVAGLLAIVRALQGLKGDRPYAPTRRIGVLFMVSLHVQLLIGLLLFVVSPYVQSAMADMKATMADAPTRFFIAEHPTLMVIAVVVMTVGSIVAKSAADDAARHRKLLVFSVVTMLLLLAGIPWQRPLFPGMGG